MRPASDQARFSQMLGRPETQKRHRPQCGSQLRMTWSPGARPETPGPTSSTTPAPSWPRMTGRGASWIPSTTCRSERQTPLAAIRTPTSPGPGGSTSTSSTRSGSPISDRIAARTSLTYHCLMPSLSERRQTVGRLREIAQVATRHGFGFVFERRALRRSAVIEAQNLPALGRHLREMLDELGPTFVKFGQLLSTRPDIVPPEILSELRLLQDSVSPVPYAD